MVEVLLRIYYVYVVRIPTENNMWIDIFSDVQYLFCNEATIINACTVQAQYKDNIFTFLDEIKTEINYMSFCYA